MRTFTMLLLDQLWHPGTLSPAAPQIIELRRLYYLLQPLQTGGAISSEIPDDRRQKSSLPTLRFLNLKEDVSVTRMTLIQKSASSAPALALCRPVTTGFQTSTIP
ncbi:hypothetical protein ABVK25_010218 [Lepraria finkii]|uniref:Uncharacterized protein n=1 Tax=Lepraria finkii TaxID=1340010 RepID=A0ABR4AXU1_9LECA